MVRWPLEHQQLCRAGESTVLKWVGRITIVIAECQANCKVLDKTPRHTELHTPRWGGGRRGASEHTIHRPALPRDLSRFRARSLGSSNPPSSALPPPPCRDAQEGRQRGKQAGTTPRTADASAGPERAGPAPAPAASPVHSCSHHNPGRAACTTPPGTPAVRHPATSPLAGPPSSPPPPPSSPRPHRRRVAATSNG